MYAEYNTQQKIIYSADLLHGHHGYDRLIPTVYPLPFCLTGLFQRFDRCPISLPVFTFPGSKAPGTAFAEPTAGADAERCIFRVELDVAV